MAFRSILFIFILFITPALKGQEIKSTVQVVAPGVQMTNKEILVTLQNSIQQFINTRKWTDDLFEAREKIEMSVFFNVTDVSQANEFQATLQITSTRPVFNSTYKTTVFSYSDDDVTFKYRELENLDFQEGQNLNDLTTLMAYYVNVVLGFDYDSYGELGGTDYFKKSLNIVNLMTGKPGWNSTDGKGIRNRYTLAENLNNNRFTVVRKLNYSYHRLGMDMFYEKPVDARAEITNSLKSLLDLVSAYGSGSLLQRTFFSAKNVELVDIFKGGTVPEKNNIIELLGQLDPNNSAKYQKIKD